MLGDNLLQPYRKMVGQLHFLQKLVETLNINFYISDPQPGGLERSEDGRCDVAV